MTAHAFTASALHPVPTLRSASGTACWCCERTIGLGARRCRHCGVPIVVARRATPARVETPAPASRYALLEPAPSPLARPVGAGSLLLSAIGLLSWCALLAV